MSRAFIVSLLAAALASPGLAQPAPARSEQLCKTLKQSAAEYDRKFDSHRPGSCGIMLDDGGYRFYVDHDDESVHVGLIVFLERLQEVNSFWFRLSTLDNLAHTALGTRQRVVFDGLNKLVKILVAERAKRNHQHDAKRHKTVQRALLGATISKEHYVWVGASAKVGDIERMQSQRQRETTGVPSAWKRILAGSLMALGSGLQRASETYEQSLASQRSRNITCYTDFLGPMGASTRCTTW